MLPQGPPAIFINVAKIFKAGKGNQNENQDGHNNYLETLEQLFSSPPFLKPSFGTEDKQDAFDFDIGLS